LEKLIYVIFYGNDNNFFSTVAPIATLAVVLLAGAISLPYIIYE
jgi:hypothetical protein